MTLERLRTAEFGTRFGTRFAQRAREGARDRPLSRRRPSRDLEHHYAIRRCERGLCGSEQRLAIEVVALSHDGQRLADAQVGIEQLDLYRLPSARATIARA